jgi:predicted ATPase
VFIEGEAGLGKTTLVQAFLERVRAGAAASIGIGQCVEHGAHGEAFMPVLDALSGICRGDGGAQAVRALTDGAPAWLLQLPGLVGGDAYRDLERRVVGVTQERMLREFAAVARALGADKPLVIVLEDLHWCDPSTLALLAWLARRMEPMRLMVLCTHRPGDAPEYRDNLTETVHGLRLRGLARVVTLTELRPAAIAAYLAERFPGLGGGSDAAADAAGAARLDELAANPYERTEGNPLFLCSVVDGWVEQGLVKRADALWRVDADRRRLLDVVPESLRRMITEQLNRLTPRDRMLLDAASVAGPRFTSALVETVLQQECESCENHLTEIADGGALIARDGEVDWPDGTTSNRFSFRHTLYREVLYAALPARRRSRLHAAIGTRLEQAYGGGARERATELAMHFTAGGEPSKAIDYRSAAAEQAFSRGGYREAIAHAEAGLKLIGQISDSAPDPRELGLQMLRSAGLVQINGWSAPDAEAALDRALVLAVELRDRRLASVLYAIAGMHELRGEYRKSQQVLERQQALPLDTPAAELESHELMACSTYHQGAFAAALEHAQAGLDAAGRGALDTKLYIFGESARVSCHNWAGLALWFLGHPARALASIDAGLALARQPTRRYSLSSALCQAATLRQLRREPERVLDYADEAIDVAIEEGFRYPLAVGRILKGWALAMTGHEQEGVNLIEQGLVGHRESGANMDRP